MLKHLHIKHFTIITELNLDLAPGLTVLTGETGAGKSILIDALELTLGARADTSFIQTGKDRCEITATFDITHIPAAQTWLSQEQIDENNECLISRILSRDGRSRNTINGRPCTLQQVRELGASLINIHGQNQHTLLTQPEYQRKLLDAFATHDTLCEAVQESYQQWHRAEKELHSLSALNGNQDQQKQWLSFQIEELQELALSEGELEAQEAQFKKLNHATQSLQVCEEISNLFSDDDHCISNQLNRVMQLLLQLPGQNELKPTMELLQQTLIQTAEMQSDIHRYFQDIQLDPERLNQIEQRLTRIHDLARKHKVSPETLYLKQSALEQELALLSNTDERIAALKIEMDQAQKTYQTVAHQLTQSRQKAAETLNQAVSMHIQQLGMQHGKLQITLAPKISDTPHPHGNESIHFLITTNPGQPPQALGKVASGGELSRISLAIQVVAAQASDSPTLIFDEVDVGVGGKTAEIVGQQLKALGQKAQVLCVTHLPQVAAQGNQHLHISKQATQDQVSTSVRSLSTAEKVQEIARMLGGVNITEKTLAHAEEMLGVSF